MGIFDRVRDIGSALSFGMVDSAKVKQAKANYERRYNQLKDRIARHSDFVSEANAKIRNLQSCTEAGYRTIIATGAIAVDQQGILRAGWYSGVISDTETTKSQPNSGPATDTKGGGVTFEEAFDAARNLAGPATLLRTLLLAAPRIGVAAPPFTIVALGIAAVTTPLSVWKAKQREKEQLNEIASNVQVIDERESAMDTQRRHLEPIIQQIAPILDRLQTATTETKSADATRRAKIEDMRTALSVECIKAGELNQTIGDTIQATTGTRDENAKLTAQLQRLASLTTELHSAAEKHEGIVNQAIDETVERIETLAQAIHDADNIIQQADPEYGNGQQ